MHNKHPHLIHPKYRPDIDGLRAVAILSVVTFHAFPSLLKSGFIGVDIFFVISGFLISTIIFSSLERERFSLLEFYIRRIRRIFPALLLILFASLALGWFVLFPDEYKQLGKHTAASAGFIQNFILWRESGYFDNAAETKPLLHLWSVAVEVQFYIFWPLLLALVWKRHWSFLKITAAIAAVSFAANIFLVYRHPSAAFYLPISRFWELMVGGVLAYVALHRAHLISQYKNGQSALGFILILIAFPLLNKGSEFPGWWALLPTLGAFFIISAGPTAWLNEKILGNKLMVWFGLISYPLYLWHWPLLSFLRVTEGDASILERLAALLIAVILAWLTYMFVEKPVRLGTNALYQSIALLVAMSMLVAIGYLGFKQNEFAFQTIEKSRPDLVIAAQNLAQSLDRINEPIIKQNSFKKIHKFDDKQRGDISNEFALQTIEKSKPDLVIVTQNLAHSLERTNEKIANHNVFEKIHKFDDTQRGYVAYFENSLPEWKLFTKMGIFEKYRSDCDFYNLEKERVGQVTQIPRLKISESCFHRDFSYRYSAFIWGDSHAQHLYYGIKKNLPADWQVLMGASSACAANPKASSPSLTNYCDQSNWFALQTIEKSKPDVVIVAQNLAHSLEHMNELIVKLEQLGVKRIIFTGPSPHWAPDLPKVIAHKLWDNTPQRTFVGIDKKVIELDKALKDGFVQKNNIIFVSLIDFFCNDKGCLTYIGNDKQAGITTFDYGHLSPIASDLLAKELLVNIITGKP